MGCSRFSAPRTQYRGELATRRPRVCAEQTFFREGTMPIDNCVGLTQPRREFPQPCPLSTPLATMHPPGQLDVSQPLVSPSPTLPPHSAPQGPPLARPGLLHRLTSSISKEDVNRMKTAASHALDMLGPLLSLASEASSDAGIPGLSIALSAVSEILTKVQVSGPSCTIHRVVLITKVGNVQHDRRRRNS